MEDRQAASFSDMSSGAESVGWFTACTIHAVEMQTRDEWLQERWWLNCPRGLAGDLQTRSVSV
jgi:hypothetical protein